MLAPLNGLLETGQIGLLITDRRGKIQACNGFIPSLFETSSEEIVDNNLKDLIICELWSVLSSNMDALRSGDTLSVEFEQQVDGSENYQSTA